jgi:hypothetical protein
MVIYTTFHQTLSNANVSFLPIECFAPDLTPTQKRSDYNLSREFNYKPAPSVKSPQPFMPPGSWNEEIREAVGPKQSWSEWLYGLAFRPSDGYSRYAFRPEIYAANNRYCGSGITLRTIHEFVQSLPGLDFSKDDHSEAVRDRTQNNLLTDHTEQSSFKIIENFFLCLAHDEKQWHYANSHVLRDYPPFGCGHFVWTQDDWDLSDGDLPQEAGRFYSFWTTFKTLKSFEWITPYTCSKLASQREERYFVFRFSGVLFRYLEKLDFAGRRINRIKKGPEPSTAKSYRSLEVPIVLPCF